MAAICAPVAMAAMVSLIVFSCHQAAKLKGLVYHGERLFTFSKAIGGVDKITSGALSTHPVVGRVPHVNSSGYAVAAHELMQIMPDTGEWIAGKLRMEFSEEDLKDPAVNIRMGTWYLNFLAERFQGEQDTIIAAYNAGHGNVEKWLEEPQYSPDGRTLSVIPFDETRNYVKKVNLAYEIYKTFYQVG